IDFLRNGASTDQIQTSAHYRQTSVSPGIEQTELSSAEEIREVAERQTKLAIVFRLLVSQTVYRYLSLLILVVNTGLTISREGIGSECVSQSWHASTCRNQTTIYDYVICTFTRECIVSRPVSTGRGILRIF